MIDQWLGGIESLIANAPGSVAAPTWESTADRTGEADAAGVIANRIFDDFFEAADVEPQRPFFVLRESQVDWRIDRNVDAQYMNAAGAIEMAYTERVINQDDDTLPVTTNTQHKAARRNFLGWMGNLIQYCAENHLSGDVQIVGIEMLVDCQRTPKQKRETARLDSDYFWMSWAFIIGEDRR